MTETDVGPFYTIFSFSLRFSIPISPLPFVISSLEQLSFKLLSPVRIDRIIKTWSFLGLSCLSKCLRISHHGCINFIAHAGSRACFIDYKIWGSTAWYGPKMAPREPQDGPKMIPRWLKMAKGEPKMAPKSNQFSHCQSTSFDSASLGLQHGPRWTQNGPNRAPRWPQDGPKMAQGGPR